MGRWEPGSGPRVDVVAAGQLYRNDRTGAVKCRSHLGADVCDSFDDPRRLFVDNRWRQVLRSVDGAWVELLNVDLPTGTTPAPTCTRCGAGQLNR